MKKTPTITKEKLDDYTNKLSSFVVSGDWQELVPDTHNILQEMVDSLRAEDVEAALAQIDHSLSYKPDDFVFEYSTDFLGPKDDDKYTCTLKIGSPKRPYTITVESRS